MNWPRILFALFGVIWVVGLIVSLLTMAALLGWFLFDLANLLEAALWAS